MGKAGNGEGTVIPLELKTKDGKPYKRWAAKITLGFDERGKQIQKWGPRRKKYGEALEDKRRMLGEAKREAKRGDKPLLGDYLTKWLEHKAVTRKFGTYQAYEPIIRNYITPALGDKRLDEITHEDVQKLVSGIYSNAKANALLPKEKRPKGKIPLDGRSTSRQTLIILRQVFARAIREGVLPRDYYSPCHDIEVPQEHTKPLMPWTPEEVLAVLRTAKKSPLYALVYTALTSGMREGELCALRWQDLKEVEIERDGENVKLLSISVNWTLKSISKKKQHLAHYSANHLWGNFYLTTPKTARSLRTILVEGDTLAVLMEHKKEQQEKRFPVNLDLVFPTRNGTPYAPRNLIRDWTKLVAEAGVPYITFHDLRDTNASYTAVRSKSFVALRDKLGHAETATTLKKYVHLLPESNLDAVLSLERMLGVKVDD